MIYTIVHKIVTIKALKKKSLLLCYECSFCLFSQSKEQQHKVPVLADGSGAQAPLQPQQDSSILTQLCNTALGLPGNSKQGHRLAPHQLSQKMRVLSQ